MLRLDNVTAFEMATKWILNTNSKQNPQCQRALEPGQCQGASIYVSCLSCQTQTQAEKAGNDEVLRLHSFQIEPGDSK